MKISTLFLTSVATLALAGCSTIPSQSHSDRGSPESLLDVSSEIVTVELISEDSITEITDWVESDQPTRAEIHCVEGDVLCDQAEETLSLYDVEYEWIPADASEINLIYERVIAHDCENRYIDNRINPYNLNHPAFGCSMASNMVQMVSDRSQFISPSLLGFYDGQMAYKNMKAYRDFDSRTYFKKDNADLGSLDFKGSN